MTGHMSEDGGGVESREERVEGCSEQDDTTKNEHCKKDRNGFSRNY